MLRDYFDLSSPIPLQAIIIVHFIVMAFVYRAWLIYFSDLWNASGSFFSGYRRIPNVNNTNSVSVRNVTLMCFCNKTGWLGKLVTLIVNVDFSARLISPRIRIQQLCSPNSCIDSTATSPSMAAIKVPGVTDVRVWFLLQRHVQYNSHACPFELSWNPSRFP